MNLENTNLLKTASRSLTFKGTLSPLCSYLTLSSPLSIAFNARSALSESLILLSKPAWNFSHTLGTARNTLGWIVGSASDISSRTGTGNI